MRSVSIGIFALAVLSIFASPALAQDCNDPTSRFSCDHRGRTMGAAGTGPEGGLVIDGNRVYLPQYNQQRYGYDQRRYGYGHNYGQYGGYNQQSGYGNPQQRGTQLYVVTPHGAFPVNADGQLTCVLNSPSDVCRLGERKTNWGAVLAGALAGAVIATVVDTVVDK